jgi:hypothetical protein
MAMLDGVKHFGRVGVEKGREKRRVAHDSLTKWKVAL